MVRESTSSAARVGVAHSAVHSTPSRVAGRSRTPPDAARRRLAALAGSATAPVPRVAGGGLSRIGPAIDDGGAVPGVPLIPPDAVLPRDGAVMDDVRADPGAGLDSPGIGLAMTSDDDVESGGSEERRRAWAARLTQSGAWGALAERWVPEPLREARIEPGKRGAVLLCTVAALAALVAAVGVWLARPNPVPVGASAAGASTAEPAEGASEGAAALADDVATDGVLGFLEGDGGDPAADAADDAGLAGAPDAGAGTPGADRPNAAGDAPSGPILVSVTGQVRKPGVVTVPADARVADAIEAAGGVMDLSLLAGMNLAAHLTDGASIVVGGPGGNAVVAESASGPSGAGAGAAASADSGPALIDINTADSATLQQLSGVGPVTAEAIIAYRTQHGPFTELSQLQEVSGIGPATYARLSPHVTL